MHTIETDLRPLHRVAVLRCVTAVDAVGISDLDRPTPCAEWTLADLLAHMTVQHRGFAAAARGRGADEAVWDVATVADAVRADPAGTYTAAAHDVLDAFAADGVMETTFALPEFGPDATFPGALAIGFHLVDYAVHGWDVAASLGASYELPADVIAAVLPLVLAIPDGDFRDTPASPFDRAVDHSAATDFEKVLLHLGRRPDWRQP
ncbi:TIGR03086 family metal-binding protein [Mycolicibacterium sp. HK-90]|uniref:TIGR03086 family metal-binding protein n=1 Tax=Mycolicibacterium sp. HK-90 TaxID=3056937 RepID=UPI002657E000|nr:TIGR03086 family metal-binding protein [Mycolicibacterium sp. HK-90]WKG05052.1 TIGR03086 family metal-binding protein [Mycolicibacterium sp. HK-90]